MTHALAILEQRLPKDLIKYIIAPMLLPSRNSVYRNKRAVLSQIGVLRPNTNIFVSMKDVRSVNNLYHHMKSFVQFPIKPCKESTLVNTKGINRQCLARYWYKSGCPPITNEWLKEKLANREICYCFRDIDPSIDLQYNQKDHQRSLTTCPRRMRYMNYCR